MRCLRCGGIYIKQNGNLEHLEFLHRKTNKRYDVTVKNVEWYKCEICGELLFPESTCYAIEKELKEQGYPFKEKKGGN